MDLRLNTNYEIDIKFAHDVKKISTAGFLSPKDVQKDFNDLYSSLPAVVEPSPDFFEKNYIGGQRPNGRVKQQTSIGLWNMREQTLNGAMRTSNNTGTWHRCLNSIIDYEHSSFWACIHSIREEENYIHCQLVKINAGQCSQPFSAYLDYNKRLKIFLAHPHFT
jgi:hypothetical protein